MTCFGLILVYHCAVAQPPPQIDAARFCALMRPFAWSRRDTPETIAEAKRINAMGVKICGWKPAAKKEKAAR